MSLSEEGLSTLRKELLKFRDGQRFKPHVRTLLEHMLSVRQ
jgi:hypothetical protein